MKRLPIAIALAAACWAWTAPVATSKGEEISGDERLREELGTLHGNVNGFDGRPTKSQVDRMDVLAMELDAAVAAFNAATTKELAVLNQELTKKKIDQIAVPAK